MFCLLGSEDCFGSRAHGPDRSGRHARGLALDLIGAVAAVGVLLAVLATARDQPSKGA